MEVNSNHRNKLKVQIKENYGKVLYSYTTQIKKAEMLKFYNKLLTLIQIILSALTGTSLFSLLFINEQWISIVGTIISIALIIVTGISKSFMFVERADLHIKAHNLYWKTVQDYVSLITDFDSLETVDIIKKRNHLIERTEFVNNIAPKTDSKSYKKAQIALQHEEEQSFNIGEIDSLLPKDDSDLEYKLK